MCGSSIAGTVSFLEEAEFNEDGSFVRTSYSGKGWDCDTTGVDHMSANESILSDIKDDQRVFLVYFL